MKVKFHHIAFALFVVLLCGSFSDGLAIPIEMEKNRVIDHRDRDPVKDFTRPWSQRRGVETFDRNAEVVLVKAPLNSLSDALAKTALEVRRNVLGSEIEISGVFQFTFQLVGHPWSILLDEELVYRNDLSLDSPRLAASPSPQPAQLSQELKAPVIRLVMSDTSGVVEYVLFENGEVTEYFSGTGAGDDDGSPNEFGLKPKKYVLSPYQDDPEGKQVVYFWSRHRQVTAKEIGDMWDFTEQFLIDHDAFDPGIDADYFLMSPIRRSGRYKVQNPGFTLSTGEVREQVTVVNGVTHITYSSKEVTSVPDLVRIDYFRFGN